MFYPFIFQTAFKPVLHEVYFSYQKNYQDVLLILNKCSYCSVRFTCFSGSDSDGFFMRIKVIKFITSEHSDQLTALQWKQVSFTGTTWSTCKCVLMFLVPALWCTPWLQRHRKGHANIPRLYLLYTGYNVASCSFNSNLGYLTLYQRAWLIIQEDFYCLQWVNDFVSWQTQIMLHI